MRHRTQQIFDLGCETARRIDVDFKFDLQVLPRMHLPGNLTDSNGNQLHPGIGFQKRRFDIMGPLFFLRGKLNGKTKAFQLTFQGIAIILQTELRIRQKQRKIQIFRTTIQSVNHPKRRPAVKCRPLKEFASPKTEQSNFLHDFA